MAKSPNFTSYSFSYKHLDYGANINNFTPPMSKEELRNQQEIARLDKADEIVQKMLTFPEAEAILNKIKETK
jgi:hypothetical protein